MLRIGEFLCYVTDIVIFCCVCDWEVLTRAVTIHKNHGSVRTLVLKSWFGFDLVWSSMDGKMQKKTLLIVNLEHEFNLLNNNS